jgi:alkylation response protein AidB-like acyl-CoA dehydrogenase
MPFTASDQSNNEQLQFRQFLEKHLVPHLSGWYGKREIPRSFFRAMGSEDWFNFTVKEGRMSIRSAFRESMIMEESAKISPGVAVAVLVQGDLGLMGLYLFGSAGLKERYAAPALKGEVLICLGNSERNAGSDVAAVSMAADKVDGGWLLNGTKAYVTNGNIGDLGVITAVSDPDADRNRRLSMFLVDLNGDGVRRRKLNKQVWIPSDLTRIQLTDVFVPDDHLMGVRGQGLMQVLKIFTHSRIPISALTLGTAEGAFTLALAHANSRRIFGKTIFEFQSKAFEAADLYAQMEASRLMIERACATMDRGEDFRLDASMAKYLSVKAAKDVTGWAADLFGAASVMYEHPIHKFPLDAWASSLGEGTQDVQKLVIFRELMKRTRMTPSLDNENR